MIVGLQLNLLLLLICLTIKDINAQNNPCPDVLKIENEKVQPDRWDGVITLVKNVDLNGVWLRVIFDREILQLGNYFGEVKTDDYQSFLIKNRNHKLAANLPTLIPFYVIYDVNQPVPSIKEFRLNGEVKCGFNPQDTTPFGQLQTSKFRPTTPSIQQLTQSQSNIFGQGFTQIPLDLQRSEEECGVVDNPIIPLIHHALPTRHGEFPWHAGIYYTKQASIEYICGGSLISKSHVLTAAHCLFKEISQEQIHPNKIVVHLGKYFLNTFLTPGLQEKQVETIIPHPEYSSKLFRHDIAIIKFDTPADYTEYVRPICLWSESRSFDAIVNREGTVTGWGIDETGELSKMLTKANLPVIPKLKCIYAYPTFYSRYVNEYTFCAGFKNGTSVCNGDSGGGLTFLKPGQNVWQLRGIVSLSVALRSRCNPKFYSVFTDIAQYLDWITYTRDTNP